MKKDKDQPARRITAAQVAKAAGVSRSSVSRAFTPGAYLDSGKRERILQMAQQLGYRPNAMAAGLQSAGRSNLVAIVTRDLMSHYDSEFLARLTQSLKGIGKWPLLLNGTDEISEAEMLGILGYPLDALILRGGTVSEEVAMYCSKLNIPLIVTGRVMQVPGVDSVCCNNPLGARIAVRALLARGRRRLGYVGGLPHLSSDQERRAGFEAALDEAGLQPAAAVQSDYSYGGGYAAAKALLRERPDLDGLFCANDAVALGALSAAQHDCGRRVPQDLAIVGFDDISMAGWPNFNLSTVRNHMEQTVQHILRLLDERLEDPGKAGEQVLLDPVFVPRGTH